jgi:hypothetical protein
MWVEKVIYCCKITYQDVENFDEDMVHFSSDPIFGNIGVSKCYFSLLWMVTNYSFIF